MAAARGRHAPPLEIRLSLQRERLLRAAAHEFARVGYSGTSSDSISRCASMSKATFYEHFADKEECILALRDEATQILYEALWDAARSVPPDDAAERNHGHMPLLQAVAQPARRHGAGIPRIHSGGHLLDIRH